MATRYDPPKREASDATRTKRPHRKSSDERYEESVKGAPPLARALLRAGGLDRMAKSRYAADSAAVDESVLRKMRRKP